MLFGDLEYDLEAALLRSLRGFFPTLGPEPALIPSIRIVHRPLPAGIPDVNQQEVFFREMDTIPGNVILGVTKTGFYDPPMARFIFGNGRDAMGALSDYRFRTESASRGLYLERMGKEIIKILGMASGLSSCRDHDCIMVYHRTMEDVDQNRNVCSGCRGKFVMAFQSIIQDKDGKS